MARPFHDMAFTAISAGSEAMGQGLDGALAMAGAPMAVFDIAAWLVGGAALGAASLATYGAAKLLTYRARRRFEAMSYSEKARSLLKNATSLVEKRRDYSTLVSIAESLVRC